MRSNVFLQVPLSPRPVKSIFIPEKKWSSWPKTKLVFTNLSR